MLRFLWVEPVSELPLWSGSGRKGRLRNIFCNWRIALSEEYFYLDFDCLDYLGWARFPRLVSAWHNCRPAGWTPPLDIGWTPRPSAPPPRSPPCCPAPSLVTTVLNWTGGAGPNYLPWQRPKWLGASHLDHSWCANPWPAIFLRQRWHSFSLSLVGCTQC